MSDRVIFYDAFNPFLVRQNVYTLLITFVMDAAVCLLGAMPIFEAHWFVWAISLFVYYLTVNLVQGVLAFPLIWRDSNGNVRMGDGPLAFIVTATFICVWPLNSISIYAMRAIAPVHQM